MAKPPDFHSGNYGFEPRRPYYCFPPANAGGTDSRANAEMTTFTVNENRVISYPCRSNFPGNVAKPVAATHC